MALRVTPVGEAFVLVPLAAPIVGISRILCSIVGRRVALLATIIPPAIPSVPLRLLRNVRLQFRSVSLVISLSIHHYGRIVAICRYCLCGRACLAVGKSFDFGPPIASSRLSAFVAEVALC